MGNKCCDTLEKISPLIQGKINKFFIDSKDPKNKKKYSEGAKRMLNKGKIYNTEMTQAFLE